MYHEQHSIQRYEERYCKILTPVQYRELSNRVRQMIKEKVNIVNIAPLEDGGKQYVVDIDGIRATFETTADTITTFLHPPINKVTIVTTGGSDDAAAVNILHSLAKKPFVKHVYALPDLTMNSPCPVGTSVEVYRHIYPSWIGTDIGCGVDLYLLKERLAEVDPKSLANTLLQKYLETDVGREKRQGKIRYEIACDDFDENLGTIGGGNHFAELMRIDSGDGSLDVSRLYLCVHTGSRDYGVDIQARFKEQEVMEMGTPEFARFLTEHNKGVSWARLNRELVAEKFCKAAGLTIERRLYGLVHNFIEQRGEIFIHRKGSIPATDGPAMIPGSRGNFSYLVESRDGEQLHSLPHGAGRKMSRGQAKEFLNSYTTKEMTRTDMGSYVVTNSRSILITEHPDCYKDIEEIMELLTADYGVTIMGRFRPLVTVKY